MITRAKDRITKIPIMGSSGDCPTGAMQFDLDWPGLWVRGDDALELYDELIEFKERVLIPKEIKRYPHSLEIMLEIIAEDVKVKR